MDTPSFLNLARNGLRVPLATDLALHEEPDPEAARRDGAALAGVIARQARRWGCPLAMPLMDLRLDKADLLAVLEINEDQADRFHFSSPLDEATRETLLIGDAPLCPASVARDEALRRIADNREFLPIGMAIGPFSLATKLMADPITAAALLGSGVSPEDAPQVRLLLDCLDVSENMVRYSVRRQIEAGARALLVCEPAASTAFLSPRQIRAGADVFERLVLGPNERIKRLMDDAGAALIFHDCGELTAEMVAAFGQRLAPAVLSLGGSRKLREDAALVPERVVLYGNLPSKSFYSDATLPLDEVRRRTAELLGQMRACGHPHILGTECDVLHVPESAETIRSKVEAMMTVEFM